MPDEKVLERFARVQHMLENFEFFFVLGAPKTGTTWLQRALDAHSQIVCVGEGHFADKFAAMQAPVLKKYFDHQKIVVKNVYEGRSNYQHRPQSTLDFLVTTFVVDAFSRLSIPAGTRWIGDKTPANVDHLALLHRLFPAAKFINIVRDGRDTLVSTFKHAERVLRNNGSLENVEELMLKQTRAYTMRWTHSLESAESFSVTHPGSLHTVRYEDLKADFGNAFKQVVQFLGADVSDAEIERCEAESSFERLSGGRKAGQEDANAFVRKGVVGDWQANLTEKHLEVFNAAGAVWLSRLGYR